MNALDDYLLALKSNTWKFQNFLCLLLCYISYHVKAYHSKMTTVKNMIIVFTKNFKE